MDRKSTKYLTKESRCPSRNSNRKHPDRFVEMFENMQSEHERKKQKRLDGKDMVGMRERRIKKRESVRKIENNYFSARDTY